MKKVAKIYGPIIGLARGEEDFRTTLTGPLRKLGFKNRRVKP